MRTLEELEAMIDGIRDAPAETGVVVLIVRRPAVDEREVVDEVRLDVAEGLVGDTWRARNQHTPDGSADPQAQLTVMNARAAEAVAGAGLAMADRRRSDLRGLRHRCRAPASRYEARDRRRRDRGVGEVPHRLRQVLGPIR